MTREEALKILDTIPTIGEQVDALEMAIRSLEADVKGEWISDDDGNISCSVCGRNGVGELFCEHCGAKMKEVEDE